MNIQENYNDFFINNSTKNIFRHTLSVPATEILNTVNVKGSKSSATVCTMSVLCQGILLWFAQLYFLTTNQ